MIPIEKVQTGTFISLPDESKKLASIEMQSATAMKVDRMVPAVHRPDQVYVSGEAFYKKQWVHTGFWMTQGMPVRVAPPSRSAVFEKSLERFQARNIGGRLHRQTVRFGGDPEIFVENTNGEVIPSTEFLPSKAHKILSDYEHTYVYWDGFQAEMEIESATCICWISDYVREGLVTILKAAKEKFPAAKLSAKTVVPIPIELLNRGSKQLLDLGCKPSFNAYGLPPLDPEQAKLVPFRFGGGHIHASPDKWFRQPMDVYVAAAKAIDRTLGVLSVSLLDKFEDPIRRQFYGKPGEFRTPPHGFEYRVMSNAIIFHPAILHLIYDMFRSFTRFHLSGFDKFWLADEQEVIETITNYDVKQARKIIDRNKVCLESLINSTFYVSAGDDDGDAFTPQAQMVKNTMTAFREGIINFMDHPYDIEKNWRIGTDKDWISHSEASEAQWGYASKLIAFGEKI